MPDHPQLARPKPNANDRATNADRDSLPCVLSNAGPQHLPSPPNRTRGRVAQGAIRNQCILANLSRV